MGEAYDADEALMGSAGGVGGEGSMMMPALIVLPVVFLCAGLAFSPQFVMKSLGLQGSNEPKVESPVIEQPTVAPDLSGFWPVLGIIGAAVGIAALAAGTFWLIRKLRRSSLAERREQEAIEEERRQALLIWKGFTDRHSTLKEKALEIETDWDMLFSYPALVDASVPQTAAFHRALRDLDSASSIAPSGLNLSMEISSLPYPKLVAEADEAWNHAWSFAKRTGLKLIPRAERKKLDQIEKLLRLARNSGGSEHERSVAYARISKLVGELQFVKIPESAMRSIEGEQRRMIEAPAHSADSSESKVAERVFAV